MVHWNYRIIKEEHEDAVDEEKVSFSIHEVYFSIDEESGRMDYEGWSDIPDGMVGDTVEELREVYDMFKSAFDKPVLEVINVDGVDKLREIQ